MINSFANATLAGGAVHSFFGGQNMGDRQIAGIDNLTAIPEPATYAAFFGLLAVGLVMLRRRVRA